MYLAFNAGTPGECCSITLFLEAIAQVDRSCISDLHSQTDYHTKLRLTSFSASSPMLSFLKTVLLITCLARALLMKGALSHSLLLKVMTQ